MTTAAYGLVGKIPGKPAKLHTFDNMNAHITPSGLTKMSIGPPLAVTAARGKGFDFGLLALLEKPEDVLPYGAHPAHLE